MLNCAYALRITSRADRWCTRSAEIASQQVEVGGVDYVVVVEVCSRIVAWVTGLLAECVLHNGEVGGVAHVVVVGVSRTHQAHLLVCRALWLQTAGPCQGSRAGVCQE